MSGTGELYLGLVLAGFALFALVLAYQSRRRTVPALAPAQPPADGVAHPG